MARPKLAVIGASHFQLPLIQKAQEMGCEVHAFAWECGDVGERVADVFHPVSITEVARIVDECREVGVDGVCTIASDLATVAVCEVAEALGLVANPVSCMRVATDKHLMRGAFAAAGDPSPRSVAVRLVDGARGVAADRDATDDVLELSAAELDAFDPAAWGMVYPLIVKPTDRSGSRGVTKLTRPNADDVRQAVLRACGESFAHEAVVEEFVEGDEFSVEGMSWEGSHRILAVTRKATTGAPHFIETGHLQPAFLPAEVEARVRAVVVHALDTLGVRYGASHTELKVLPSGDVKLIEVGARMGGDCIGSHLVPLSTGIDFVGAVVSVALGHEPDLAPAAGAPGCAAVRICFTQQDLSQVDELCTTRPDLVRYVYRSDAEAGAREVLDSSTRLGHVVLAAADPRDLAPYVPASLASVAGEA